MSNELNYGDRVQSKADEIVGFMDRNDRERTRRAFTEELGRMSPQEWKRLLQTVESKDQKNQGIDLKLKPQPDQNGDGFITFEPIFSRPETRGVSEREAPVKTVTPANKRALDACTLVAEMGEAPVKTVTPANQIDTKERCK